MTKLKGTMVAVVVAAGLYVATLMTGVVVDYFDRDSIPHRAIRLHLQLVCAGIYESHSKTGRWPERFEDLADTTLAHRVPNWRMVESQTIVVLWRADLKPDPKDNARVILAYYNKGLFSKLGRMWVCWGDLRTEYLKADEVRATYTSRH
jgi:hypothetical protein